MTDTPPFIPAAPAVPAAPAPQPSRPADAAPLPMFAPLQAAEGLVQSALSYVPSATEQAVVDMVTRRTYKTTGAWALVLGPLGSLGVAKLGISGSEAVQVLSVTTPFAAGVAVAVVEWARKSKAIAWLIAKEQAIA